MKLNILGRRREVHFASADTLLEVYGKADPCLVKGGVIYVDKDVLSEEIKNVGKHLTIDEIVEDIYRETRNKYTVYGPVIRIRKIFE